MKTGSGKLAGSAGSRISSAAGPPVETPMASAVGVEEIACCRGGGAKKTTDAAGRKRPVAAAGW